jgi:hypothetical protein
LDVASTSAIIVLIDTPESKIKCTQPTLNQSWFLSRWRKHRHSLNENTPNRKVRFLLDKLSDTWKIPHHSSEGAFDLRNLVAWTIKGNCKFSLDFVFFLACAFPIDETRECLVPN